MEFPSMDTMMREAEFKALTCVKNKLRNKKFIKNKEKIQKNNNKYNPFGFISYNYELKNFNDIKPFFQKKMNSDILFNIEEFIGKKSYYVSRTKENIVTLENKKILYIILYMSLSITNDWMIDSNQFYMKRKLNGRIIDLNQYFFELVCKDDGVSKSFELNFFIDTSLYKSKIIYSIKFDECIWKFNSKEKEILKDPSKYNCNEICDRYFVNFIHKNILKNFKFTKK